VKPRVAVDGLIDWSAYAPAGVDCLGFVACMTADQLGISGPKPVVDLTTGEVWIDHGHGRPSVDPPIGPQSSGVAA
jgi:hypothetical protein